MRAPTVAVISRCRPELISPSRLLGLRLRRARWLLTTLPLSPLPSKTTCACKSVRRFLTSSSFGALELQLRLAAGPHLCCVRDFILCSPSSCLRGGGGVVNVRLENARNCRAEQRLCSGNRHSHLSSLSSTWHGVQGVLGQAQCLHVLGPLAPRPQKHRRRRNRRRWEAVHFPPPWVMRAELAVPLLLEPCARAGHITPPHCVCIPSPP